MLATLDKITSMCKWTYKRKYKRIYKKLYKIWTHKLYSLKSILKSLLVLGVTSYMEKFKEFKKGYKIAFATF